MLADVNSNLLTLMMMRVHKDPLDEIVAVLVASNVDKWDAWAVWASGGDDSKIAIQKFKTTNLETLLNDLGGELIDAIAIRVGKDVVDDSSLVRG